MEWAIRIVFGQMLQTKPRLYPHTKLFLRSLPQKEAFMERRLSQKQVWKDNKASFQPLEDNYRVWGRYEEDESAWAHKYGPETDQDTHQQDVPDLITAEVYWFAGREER